MRLKLNRYGTSSLSSSSDLSRSKSSHALKSREPSPDRSGDKDGAALSSWARYLKNKYGSRSAKDSPRELTGTSSATSSSSAMSPSTTARRLSLGLPLRQANEMHSSDDDSKNGLSSPTSPTVAAAGNLILENTYLNHHECVNLFYRYVPRSGRYVP